MEETDKERSKFAVGYTGEYFWDHYRKVGTTWWQIPGNVADRLVDVHLPEYLKGKFLRSCNKRFVIVYSVGGISVAIENHDGKLSLVLIDRPGDFPVCQWQKIMDMPRTIAEYWLKTPSKKLLSHDREDSFNSLEDERSLLFNLFNFKSGLRLVAGNRFDRHQLALRCENGNYSLYAFKAYN